MDNTQANEIKQLDARIADLSKRSLSGEVGISVFLSPSQQALSRQILMRQGVILRAAFFGGYADAERKRIFILPSYADDFDGTPEQKLIEYFSDEVLNSVQALLITGSGYRELSHRDYLGSLLSVGIERDVLGDIVVVDERSAVIFCSGKISEFIKISLSRVSNDCVTVCAYEPDENFSAKREYKQISATVASCRLDCVVSALTGLSREKTQELIRHELCQLNHLTECRCDLALDAPCVISVRGYGKYILREFNGLTKKGRMRMLADKYI